MSDDQGEKHFDPTPARKARALREGSAARSTEVDGIVAFASAAGATVAVVPAIGFAAIDVLQRAAAGREVANASLAALAVCAVLPAVAAAAGGCAAGIAQTGGVRCAALKLDPSKLDPRAGLKRMLGGEALTGAARAVAAFALTAVLLVPILTETFARAATLGTPLAFGALVERAAVHAFGAALAVGAVFAAADYALARRRWLARLKMSHADVKRDQKENDGDPQTRSRRMVLHRSFARGAVTRTEQATFVLVNPTHIAIAVRYAPPEVAVPEILVRAAGDAAERVKAIAVRRGIPIVENVALARALYASGVAGRAIPGDTFVAVAQVIAALIRAGVIA